MMRIWDENVPIRMLEVSVFVCFHSFNAEENIRSFVSKIVQKIPSVKFE